MNSERSEFDLNDPQLPDFYDELPLWSAPFGLLLLDAVPLPESGTVLDVGAGTGFVAVELAQRCGASIRVIAVDPWHSAVLRLRKKCEYFGIRNVEAIEQDAAALELAADSIDLIVSNLGINNFQDPAAVLRQCFRVAKPGAPLVLCTNVVGHMAEFYDVFCATLTAMHDSTGLAALDAHIVHRGTAESVSQTVREAGFEVGGVTRDSFRMRFASGSALLEHAFIRLGFLPAWRAVAAAGAREGVMLALERNLNAAAGPRGLELTIPMACIHAHKPASMVRSLPPTGRTRSA